MPGAVFDAASKMDERDDPRSSTEIRCQPTVRTAETAAGAGRLFEAWDCREIARLLVFDAAQQMRPRDHPHRLVDAARRGAPSQPQHRARAVDYSSHGLAEKSHGPSCCLARCARCVHATECTLGVGSVARCCKVCVGQFGFAATC